MTISYCDLVDYLTGNEDNLAKEMNYERQKNSTAKRQMPTHTSKKPYAEDQFKYGGNSAPTNYFSPC